MRQTFQWATNDPVVLPWYTSCQLVDNSSQGFEAAETTTIEKLSCSSLSLSV